MRFPIRVALCVAFFFSGLALATQQEETVDPSRLTALDLLRIQSVGSPTLSPDGQWVLYTQTERDMDDEELESRTHIWRVLFDGSDRRKMTYGKEDCTSPAWLPDGKRFAFLSERDSGESPDGPKSQLFLMFADGGEAWPVTTVEEGVQSFEISPDGHQVLLSIRDVLSKEEKEKKKLKDDAEVVDEKFQMTHLWVQELTGGEPRRLTEGPFTTSDARWAPDGRRVAYVTRPNPKNDLRWQSDIWVLDLQSKESRRLNDNPGADDDPRWSPDGKTIAFASHPYVGSHTWYRKLHLAPIEGGEPRVLLESLDIDFGNHSWSPDGQTIYWSSGDKTTDNLFSVNVASGQTRVYQAPRGRNGAWELSRDGSSWVFVHSPSNWPSEVYTAAADLSEMRPVSNANSWLSKRQIELAKAETIRWKNSEGQWIEGVLTRPPGSTAGKSYPLILNPHGGPSGAVTESFNFANQILAASGYLILQPNFRGSSNYGQEFLNANRDYWGIRDYDDCMTGVDFTIEQGWADPDRLACYGWSYGGYLSFWISTQTERFKAISPGAGLSNLYSMYSTTDIPGYLGWFFGTPWDNEEIFEKLSAIRHVKKVTSPMLILHGAEDSRVPPEQSVEFYQALRDLNKEVTFVLYPREGHGIREPRHQVDRIQRWLDFFARHLGTPKAQEVPTGSP